jgi:hypothetical protein
MVETVSAGARYLTEPSGESGPAGDGKRKRQA